MQSTRSTNAPKVVLGTLAALVLGAIGSVAAYVVTLIASVPANMLVNGSYEGWAIPAAAYGVAMALGFLLPFGATLALLRASLLGASLLGRREGAQPTARRQAVLGA